VVAASREHNVRTENEASTPQGPHPTDRYLFAVLLIAIAALVVTLPFTLESIRTELFDTQVDDLYDFPSGKTVGVSTVEAVEKTKNYYTITILSVNDDVGSLTLAVSGNRTCEAGKCPELAVLLIAYNSDVILRRGLPPSASVKIAENDVAFSDEVTLPGVGWPSKYPFDHYRLRLGVAVSQVVNGTVRYLSTDEAKTGSYGTIQNATRDFDMGRPVEVPVQKVITASDSFSPTGVVDIVLQRPAYLQVLAIALVTLITISTMLSLMSRSVGDALVGIGSMVMGVWGIRTVLVPSGLGVVTAVDISLSLVIMLLLFGLTVRTAQHLRRRSDIKLVPKPLRKH